MPVTRQLCATVFFLILGASAVYPQTVPTRSIQEPSPRTSIIIERQLVRFATTGEALELRLVVAEQQGEVVFDSGFLNAVSFDWPLTGQQGEAVASGLYTYTLSTKAATDEAARTQHGQVIIDRASSNDRVWLTGNPQTSLGADSQALKVIVLGSSQTTIAGAEFPVGSPPGIGERAFPNRTTLPGSGDKPEAKAAASIISTNAVNISGTGSTNRIAKWTNGPSGVLGDSSVAEVNGKVGIGTASPGTKLDIQGSVGTFNGVAVQLFNSNAGNTNPWVLGTGGAVVAQDAFSIGDSSTYKMTILSNGKVGVGTTSPQATLDVRGDIRLGFNGGLSATSSEENLRIVRGTVDYAGNIIGGGDFTVSHSNNGVYYITFNTPFVGNPTVTATVERAAIDGDVAVAMTDFVNRNQTKIVVLWPYNDSLCLTCGPDIIKGQGTDRVFSFIAIGPR
jgi:hypothetical protein